MEDSNSGSHGRGRERAGVDSAAKLAHVSMIVEALRYGWPLTKFLDKWDSFSEKHAGRERSDMRHIGNMQRLMAKGYLSQSASLIEEPQEPVQEQQVQPVPPSVSATSATPGVEAPVLFLPVSLGTQEKLQDLGYAVLEQGCETQTLEGYIDFWVNTARTPVHVDGQWFVWAPSAELLTRVGSGKKLYNFGISCAGVTCSSEADRTGYDGRLVVILGNKYLRKMCPGDTNDLRNRRYLRCFRGIGNLRLFCNDRTAVRERGATSHLVLADVLDAGRYIEYVDNVGTLKDKKVGP